MKKLKIRKNATVEVIAGDDKGKKGTVIEINSIKMLIKVQGVKIQTHFDRKDGLVKKEGFLNYSNVKLVSNPTEKKAPSKRKSASAK